MISDLKVNKPEPITSGKPTASLERSTDVELTIEILEAGKPVLISAFYSDGLTLIRELQYHLGRELNNETYREKRHFRSEFHRLSYLILIEIVDHKLAVKKAPLIGWLEKLYPETGDFMLTFPQVLELNSAWQWYLNGVSVSVLRNKIHPYYGTVFPTRFEHLQLFENWLKRYNGPKKTAINVGFESGVLSFQMIKHGFQKVFGTETNPNAIIGLTAFMGTTKLSRKLELDFGPLFGKYEKQTELIVFNPPRLKESYEPGNNNRHLSYPVNLFDDFFEGAKQRLLPDGKLVFIISNSVQIYHIKEEHPVEKELNEGDRFQLERCFKKKLKDISKNANKNEYTRAEEEVELWVLTHQ